MKLSTASLVSESNEALPATGANPCPKCGKALVDPDGLGWCASCGYCASLAGDDAKKLVAERKGPGLSEVVQAVNPIQGLPVWFWACFVFVALGIVFTLYMGNRLPEGDNFERAVWATGFVVAGLALIFFAQVSALISIAPEDIHASFKDALVPFRLWGCVFRRLPRLKECLWTALLGLSLIVGSIAFVGGFQHWFSYLPKSAAQLAREKPAPVAGHAVSIGD